MNALWLIILRTAGLAVSIGGRQREADYFYQLADLAEASALTDAHMAEIAELLKERDITQVDVSGVVERIKALRAQLHDTPPG